ncbi:MAG: RyR domain-containing protein [Thermoguttaceae bacterium]
MYTPTPIPTAGISLPAELVALTEKLAENTHDNWAARRIRDGWKYGLARNDAAKEHPCLVPYSELPESEKEYDRVTATETLKAILALGYSIK